MNMRSGRTPENDLSPQQRRQAVAALLAQAIRRLRRSAPAENLVSTRPTQLEDVDETEVSVRTAGFTPRDDGDRP